MHKVYVMCDWTSTHVAVSGRVCAEKGTWGIKEHEAGRHSKSRTGLMVMALACSLYIANNTLMLV